MSEISFEDLRRANVRREVDFETFYGEGDASTHNWTPLEIAGAACGEAGEMANKAKKLKRGQGVTVDDILDEAADTIIYLDLLAKRLGGNLAEAVARKFNARSADIHSEVRL